MADTAPPKPRSLAFVYEGTTYGGTEEYILLLLRHMDRRRYDPCVVTTGYNYPFCPPRFIERVAELQIPFYHTAISARSRAASVAFDVYNLHRLLRDHHVKVMHIHTQRPDGGRRATLAARLAGVKGVLRSEHLPPSSNFSPQLPLSVKLYDYLTDYVIAGSQSCLDEQFEMLQRDRKKTLRIFYGIELERFNPQHDVKAAKRRLGLDPAIPTVGKVARLSPEKGYVYFIKAAGEIIRQYGPVNFLVIGNGPMEQELRALVAELRIEQHVHFLGFQSDTVPCIEAMDVAAMTSVSEGISLAMLEFMAMGKPIVATSEPSFAETIVDRESGLLAKLMDPDSIAEATLQLLRSPQLAHRIGAAACQRVHECFDIHLNVARMMSLYDSTMSGHGI